MYQFWINMGFQKKRNFLEVKVNKRLLCRSLKLGKVR